MQARRGGWGRGRGFAPRSSGDHEEDQLDLRDQLEFLEFLDLWDFLDLLEFLDLSDLLDLLDLKVKTVFKVHQVED